MPDQMTPVCSPGLLKKLAALRVELVDLAFVMDRRGRLDAADVAMTASVRIGELYDEAMVIENVQAVSNPHGQISN